MIIRYLDNIDPNEKYKQYAKQFPADTKSTEAVATAYANDCKQLHTVVKSICDAKEKKDYEKAIKNFKIYWDEKLKHTIENGWAFNIKILLNALKLYIENFDALGDAHSHKNLAFWGQIIGYLQRFIPACYAHVLCEGLRKLTRKNFQYKRVLITPNIPYTFFPLDSDPEFLLGSNCAMTWHASIAIYASKREATECFDLLNKLYEIKAAALLQLFSPDTRHESKAAAVEMPLRKID